MSRWQPPYPGKPAPRQTRCIWPGCHDTYRPFPKIPMCDEHTAVVYTAYDARIQSDLKMIRARRLDDEMREEARLRAKAERDKRITAALINRVEVVYYILVGKHIKIGFSTNMESRARAYPPDAQVLGIEYGGKDMERQRHQQFEAYRALGREWFVDHDEIRNHIRDNCYAWSPSRKPTAGPSGPRRAKMRLHYGQAGEGYKVS